MNDHEKALELARLAEHNCTCDACVVRRAYLDLATRKPSVEHEFSQRDGFSVCSKCGIVENKDKPSECRRELPAIAPRTKPSVEERLGRFLLADLFNRRLSAFRYSTRAACVLFARVNEYTGTADGTGAESYRQALSAALDRAEAAEAGK